MADGWQSIVTQEAQTNTTSGSTDLETGGRARFTFAGHHTSPVWTPDGSRLTFATRKTVEGIHQISWQSADGASDVELLVEKPNNTYPVSWSPDGRTLAFVEGSTGPRRISGCFHLVGNQNRF